MPTLMFGAGWACAEPSPRRGPRCPRVVSGSHQRSCSVGTMPPQGHRKGAPRRLFSPPPTSSQPSEATGAPVQGRGGGEALCTSVGAPQPLLVSAPTKEGEPWKTGKWGPRPGQERQQRLAGTWPRREGPAAHKPEMCRMLPASLWPCHPEGSCRASSVAAAAGPWHVQETRLPACPGSPLCPRGPSGTRPASFPGGAGWEGAGRLWPVPPSQGEAAAAPGRPGRCGGLHRPPLSPTALIASDAARGTIPLPRGCECLGRSSQIQDWSLTGGIGVQGRASTPGGLSDWKWCHSTGAAGCELGPKQAQAARRSSHCELQTRAGRCRIRPCRSPALSPETGLGWALCPCSRGRPLHQAEPCSQAALGSFCTS